MKRNNRLNLSPVKIFRYFMLFILIAGYACSQDQDVKQKESEKTMGAWWKDAVIYEVNVRQYTPEGTFNAFAEHLPRLKELGVDILWFMPVHPIGEVNRKGDLGSYYSVKDYYGINPEFGTMEDFKRLVDRIHDMGMYVIIDWVANHSAWDNPLAEEYPDWYQRDEDGNFISPFDWTDVIAFDYENEEPRNYMAKVMQYWLSDAGVDGFRCDVAHQVPVDFWEELRPRLDRVKNVFMLAESDQPELHKSAFHMSYAWPMHHVMNEIARGEKTAKAIVHRMNKIDSLYPEGSILMQFTSNHDENSWAGTVYDRLGDGVKAFAAFTFTIPGMPLIYNGQEAGLDQQLEFFERDTIEWKEEHEMFDYYKKLIRLKKENEALWNGNYGGDHERVMTTDNYAVYTFLREKNDNRVFSVFNFTDSLQQVTLKASAHAGDYTNYFSGEEISFKGDDDISLEPWEYRIFVGK